MDLLVLGGSRFVGRAIVEAAAQAGCRVTVLNNDCKNPFEGRGIERIYADRFSNEGLSALSSGVWDVVVDTWSGDPAAVSLSLNALRNRVSIYCYVSSVSVYSPEAKHPLVESSEVLRAPFNDLASYSVRKAAAETAVTRVMRDRALILRPSAIVGPWEYPGRLPWWIRRCEQFDNVLCPGPRSRRIAWADVRDLASWIVQRAATAAAGVFNFVCPDGHLTMEIMVELCKEVSGHNAKLHWVEEDVLVNSGVRPWIDIPLWLPPRQYSPDAYAVDGSLALLEAAQFRSARETVSDVCNWLRGLSAVEAQYALDSRTWLSRAVEETLLARARL